ncbi:cysteine-rich DPF motif domain-containing protein 1 isoform X1 [Acinonyx jubatus]|uniref:Cysteine-rich DPF motif domain-containing protein 1 n=1 Tax=Acinonyx jubatus TaxID=32536 RepID=A0ABM3N7T5_ACIJB|nr:cysteine-rich DPF motif domain-containing protein 1 isoform X1 [Acinonyx jubatus]
MECEADHRPLGVFKCQLCALTAPYSYVGQKPPDTQSVVFLEESYVMKDPFTSDKGRFLVLGSQCSLCSRLVCVGPVGEHRCLPLGNSARLGEKERSVKEACQPAWFEDMSAAWAREGAELGTALPSPFRGHQEQHWELEGAGAQPAAARGQGDVRRRPSEG